MILTEEYLRNYAKTEMRHSITESMNSLSQFSFESQYDIFISHSSLDKEIVCAIYDLLVRCGFKAYVDYEDNELSPKNVTKETGIKLRQKLKMSTGLAYIATSNVTSSKWCPWELGIFDGISDGKCCILPILKTTTSSFNGQEYLGMYPYLSFAQISGSKEWTFWVEDPNNSNKYTSLKAWLKGCELKLHE